MNTPPRPSPPAPGARFRGRACPCCSGTTERVARHFLDRLLSVFIPVSRYRCTTPACSWEGVLQPRGSARALPAAPPRRGRRVLTAARLENGAVNVFEPRGR